VPAWDCLPTCLFNPTFCETPSPPDKISASLLEAQLRHQQIIPSMTIKDIGRLR
jgi:hypothetical protein